jgi:glycosyltransferase involved in cell wall biosynthesis
MTMQRKKVLLITGGNKDQGGARIRVLNHFDRMKDYFIPTWVPRIGILKRDTLFERMQFLFLKAWFTVKRNFLILFMKYDMVYIQTMFLEKWQLKLFRKRGTTICFDFDDAIYTYSRYSFDLMIEYSNKLIIASPYLAVDFPSEKKSYKVIYSPVDTDLISTAVDKHSVFTIGWIGSPWTVVHLESIKQVFIDLAKKMEFKLLIVGAQMELPGVNIECIDWSVQNEINSLKKIDVGIMPLNDHDWSPKKGGYKLYLYMAAGRPVIATPIGINQIIVKHLRNGYHANSLAEWEDALIQLANNDKLCKELGRNARQDAENLYSYNVCTAKLLDYLNT